MDLNKSLIDNLEENDANNNPNNKSQDIITQQKTSFSLGVRNNNLVTYKKNSINNNTLSNINRKKKSIYFGAADSAVKINVLGSEGKNIYGKMNSYLDKFQKNVVIQDTPLNNVKNKTDSLKKNSINPKIQTKLNNITNNGINNSNFIYMILFLL